MKDFRKNKRFTFFSITLLFFIVLMSCDNKDGQIKSLEEQIINAENSFSDFNKDDWKLLEEKMMVLQNDVEQNREKYTEAQIKEIAKLQGRYFVVVAKKGINDLGNSVKNLGNQMEGFLEGITDSTNFKQY